MKKLLALVLVLSLMGSFAISKAEEPEEVASGDIFDSVYFSTDSEREICREIVQYISLHVDGDDVYWRYTVPSTLFFSIGSGMVYDIDIKDGMPDDETIDALIEKNQEVMESIDKVPLGYFNLAEMEKVMILCFEGTNLTYKQEEGGFIICSGDVECGGVPFFYGPDGSLYCRKYDLVSAIVG